MNAPDDELPWLSAKATVTPITVAKAPTTAPKPNGNGQAGDHAHAPETYPESYYAGQQDSQEYDYGLDESLAQLEDERPRLLDLAKLAATEPEPPRFVVKDWLPEGEVTLFAGHGGSGKSAIALDLALCIAAGRPWMGIETAHRRTCFVSLEDAEKVLHWRLRRQCAHYEMDLATLDRDLVLYDGSHSDGALLVEMNRAVGFTAVYAWLKERMAESGAQVLVLDGASDAYSANENIRSNVRLFMRGLRSLVPSNGAVVLLAHVDKGAAKNGDTSQGYSGSTAWSNSARARWYLKAAGEESEELILEQQKSNYAQAGGQVRIRWNSQSHVFEAAEASAPLASRGLIDLAQRNGIMRALRACIAGGDYCPATHVGARNAFTVLSAFKDFPDSLRSDRKGFVKAIEKLRSDGKVREGSLRLPDRHLKACLVPVGEDEPTAAPGEEPT